LARKLASANQFDEALTEIRAVISIDPNNLPARELRQSLLEESEAAKNTAKHSQAGAV
jgi:hypothetical protein